MIAEERLEHFVNGTHFRTLVVAAHPDDETLWAGILLADRQAVSLVHVTDGAPRNPYFARQAGCNTREEYAQLRSRELDSALNRLGLSVARRLSFGACDQEAVFETVRLTEALTSELRTFSPDIVLTHAYDGGHPDHDAAAFIARAAIAKSARRCALLEFPGYHAVSATGERTIGFLPRALPSLTRVLTPAESERKNSALACFASQREIIASFPIGTESLRVSGLIDFNAPPHEGPLHYETHGWPLRAENFREEIRRAARILDVPMELG